MSRGRGCNPLLRRWRQRAVKDSSAFVSFKLLRWRMSGTYTLTKGGKKSKQAGTPICSMNKLVKFKLFPFTLPHPLGNCHAGDERWLHCCQGGVFKSSLWLPYFCSPSEHLNRRAQVLASTVLWLEGEKLCDKLMCLNAWHCFGRLWNFGVGRNGWKR